MLPLSLLKSATEYPILIELKNGETYNGVLTSIDLWMNVNLKDVVRTCRDGKEFWKMKEMYIRGNTIKYVRVPDAVLDGIEEERAMREAGKRRGGGKGRNRQRNGGGGGGGVGGGGGGGGGSGMGRRKQG